MYIDIIICIVFEKYYLENGVNIIIGENLLRDYN